MNLLLLSPDELDAAGHARLSGPRRTHALEVLQVSEGDALKVGVRGGRVGTATVTSKGDPLELAVKLEREPPPRPGLDLVLALPRPKALQPADPRHRLARLRPGGAAERLSRREELLRLAGAGARVRSTSCFASGLEQATRHRRARSCCCASASSPSSKTSSTPSRRTAQRWVLHPGPARPPPPRAPGQRAVLAVGPEGGLGSLRARAAPGARLLAGCPRRAPATASRWWCRCWSACSSAPT